jgi:hypothetical protein
MPTLTESERAGQQAIIDKYGAEGQKYVTLINKQRDYADTWAYDDVKAAADKDNLDAFLNKILNVNTDAYSDADVAPDWAALATDLKGGIGRVDGMGTNYQDQMAISAQLYLPEWQRAIDRMKQDSLIQAQQANRKAAQAQDNTLASLGTSGISGGKRGAAISGAQGSTAQEFQVQAQAKQRALDDWKRNQRSSLVGYAGQVRNDRIDQYNDTETANSGITDTGLINMVMTNNNNATRGN